MTDPDLVEAGDLQEGMEEEEAVVDLEEVAAGLAEVDLQEVADLIETVVANETEAAAAERAEADLEGSFNLYAVVQLLWPSG